MKSDITLREVSDAVVTPEFAAFTRTDLTPEALHTWDPTLPRDARLLVPMDLQALVVPQAGSVQCVPTETVVPVAISGADIGDALPVPPQPFGAPSDRAAGIHLHWAMPDGLTRGDGGSVRAETPAAGNPMGLPPLPDRWVVVRLVHGQSTLRCWVLEADRGDHHDLAGWTEPGPLPEGTETGSEGRRVIPREKLTSVAGGDAAWAATYDAVLNRFAFHDDLSDVEFNDANSFSYLVCGWWSAAQLDPLHDCDGVGAYQNRTRWLGWLAPEPSGLAATTAERKALRSQRQSFGLASPPVAPTGKVATKGFGVAREDVEVMHVPSQVIDEDATLFSAPGPAMPRQTMLHGAVMGIALADNPDLIPAAASIEAAVGPTAFAALSALLADGADALRDSSERLLAAFSSGLLPVIDTKNGVTAVDEERHAAGFTGLAGGMRKRPDRIAEGDILASGSPTAVIGGLSPPTSSRASGLSFGDTAKATLVPMSRYQVRDSTMGKRFGGLRFASTPPRSFRDVSVPLPRMFVPTDLALVLRACARSQRHGGDGRFSPTGRLVCRLPSQVVTAIRGLLASNQLPEGLKSVGSGAVPPEVDLLLNELLLTDPYRWQELVKWTTEAREAEPPDPEPPGDGGGDDHHWPDGDDRRLAPQMAIEDQIGDRVRAEAALRHVAPVTRLLQPEVDERVTDTLREASLQVGDDVSPVGITRWAQPWVPLWCDWELLLAVDDNLDRWRLGPIDFEADPAIGAAGTQTHVVSGRALLASSTARALSAQIRQWLSEEDARDAAGLSQITDKREAELAAAATAADGLDVLSGTFSGIREILLGLDPLDASRKLIASDGTATSRPRALMPPLLLAGGAAKVQRLRLVDAFGRWVDVPAGQIDAIEIAATNRHPDGAPNLTLPPRLQRPGRLSFRFVDPSIPDGDPDVEACIDQQHPEQAISPIAGWLLPDHVDEALEFFDASGRPLGQLMHDELTGNVVWEGPPGRQGPMGGPPDPGSDPSARHLARLAAGAVSVDVAVRHDASSAAGESALSALLRAIDTTMWTVDPLGSLGTGAVAGLVGRPIAVVRAILTLELDSDVDAFDYDNAADRAARAQAYANLAARALAVRLGELTRTDDGLLAFVVDDDYSKIRVVAPEVLSQARICGRMQGQLSVYARGSEQAPGVSAITHPYIDSRTHVELRCAQTVRLTLLMNPGGKVHASSGVLPRKSLALARDWFHDALVRLSPSFRVGPVLVDPSAVRLPMITGLGDKQVFTRRDSPVSWRDDAISAATQTAFLPDQPSTLQEGWIRVQQVDAEDAGGGTP